MSVRFLEGRVAWVTGGATGIGRAIVMGLAEAGADVAFGSLPQSASAGILPEQNVTTVNEGEHDETAAAALEYGSRILARPFDVSSDGDVATAHRDVVDGLGPVDILVNAAATSGYHPLVDHPDEVWTRILDTNLNGPFRTIRRCLGSMIARRWAAHQHRFNRLDRRRTDLRCLLHRKNRTAGFDQDHRARGSPYGVELAAHRPRAGCA